MYITSTKCLILIEPTEYALMKITSGKNTVDKTYFPVKMAITADKDNSQK